MVKTLIPGVKVPDLPVGSLTILHCTTRDEDMVDEATAELLQRPGRSLGGGGGGAGREQGRTEHGNNAESQQGSRRGAQGLKSKETSDTRNQGGTATLEVGGGQGVDVVQSAPGGGECGVSGAEDQNVQGEGVAGDARVAWLERGRERDLVGGSGEEGCEEVWRLELVGDVSLLNKTDALLEHLWEPYPYAD